MNYANQEKKQFVNKLKRGINKTNDYYNVGIPSQTDDIYHIYYILSST